MPYADTVRVEGRGRDDVLTVQLVPRWANVEVRSEPAGATIYAGEQSLGTTPAVVELLEGSHQLSVVLEGYSAWDGSVAATANVDQVLPTIRLQPANA